jgi:hypothetical protein
LSAVLPTKTVAIITTHPITAVDLQSTILWEAKGRYLYAAVMGTRIRGKESRMPDCQGAYIGSVRPAAGPVVGCVGCWSIA